MKTPTKITFDDDGWPVYVPVLKPGDISLSTIHGLTTFDKVYKTILNPPRGDPYTGVAYVVTDAMAMFTDTMGFDEESLCESWNDTWRRLGYTEPGPDIDVEIS